MDKNHQQSKDEQTKPSYKAILHKLKKLEVLICIFCISGILVCLYTIQVEILKASDKNYRAFCDISSYISCTKVFTSKYGKGFGLFPQDSFLNQPNSIYGLLFFITELLLLLFRNNNKALMLKFVLSVAANLGNVYLAYILYFVLQDFCIVCVTFYVINIFLLFFNYKHYNYKIRLNELIVTKKKQK